MPTLRSPYGVEQFEEALCRFIQENAICFHIVKFFGKDGYYHVAFSYDEDGMVKKVYVSYSNLKHEGFSFTAEPKTYTDGNITKIRYSWSEETEEIKKFLSILMADVKPKGSFSLVEHVKTVSLMKFIGGNDVEAAGEEASNGVLQEA